MRTLEELIEKRVKFNKLTLEEKQAYTNGCGPQKSWLKVPQFIFNASCNHHDWQYQIGGSERDRAKADHQFYDKMLKDCMQYKYNLFLFIRYHIWAYIYFLSVRYGGRKCYRYREKTK